MLRGAQFGLNFSENWHELAQRPFTSKKMVLNKIQWPLPVLQRDNDSLSKNVIFLIMKNFVKIFFLGFFFQPKYLKCSPLSFDVHIMLLSGIWKFRISKNFEKNFEEFSKIFKIIFFEFFGKNEEEWYPRISQIPFSLYFGLDRWRLNQHTLNLLYQHTYFNCLHFYLLIKEVLTPTQFSKQKIGIKKSTEKIIDENGIPSVSTINFDL